MLFGSTSPGPTPEMKLILRTFRSISAKDSLSDHELGYNSQNIAIFDHVRGLLRALARRITPLVTSAELLCW